MSTTLEARIAELEAKVRRLENVARYLTAVVPIPNLGAIVSPHQTATFAEALRAAIYDIETEHGLITRGEPDGTRS